MDLTGKTAVVTGSSRGVGRAVALAYGKAGANVVVNYSSSEGPAKEVVKEIENAGSKAVAVKADVSVAEEAQALVNAGHEHFGSVDILVNNAGVSWPALLLKMTEEQWDRVVDIHLKGAFLCTQAAGKFMKEQNSGKIINVSSVAGGLRA